MTQLRADELGAIFFFVMALLVMSLSGTSLVYASSASEQEWRGDVPCGRKLAGPVVTEVAGCASAYCIKTSESTQVCSCLRSEDSDEIELIMRINGELNHVWKTGVVLTAEGLELRIDAADLDGDGKEEWLIALFEGSSNGMGVTHWKVWALTGNNLSNPVDVEDYGVMAFLTGNECNRCRLLVTRWLTGWEARRGPGLYLAGAWFELLPDSELSVRFDRPAIKRRYLKSFQRIRNDGFRKDSPVLWYNDFRATPITGPYPFTE